MQIVIDIDEKIYEARQSWVSNPKRQITDLDFAVANGTPLHNGYWTIKQYLVPIKNEQVPTIVHTALSIESTACKIVHTYTHSSCKSEEYLNKYNYCPNCGAKMFEPQGSEEENADTN